MTTEEQISIMQAFVEGKQIQWRCCQTYNDWTNTNEPIWNWEELEYRIKPDPNLPKTWEEFCETHPIIQENEAYINNCSKVIGYNGYKGHIRVPERDKNIMPNKEVAESVLALCQLIQLRDCYNEGWKPDWCNKEDKYVIYVSKGELVVKSLNSVQFVLTFKTETLRDEFFKNFKELIEVAKELI